MKREDLVKIISEKAKLNKKQSEEALKAVLGGISGALEGGEKVTFVGFGSFSVIERKAREGRNPKTGKPIHIPATKVPKFSAGKALKEAVK